MEIYIRDLDLIALRVEDAPGIANPTPAGDLKIIKDEVAGAASSNEVDAGLVVSAGTRQGVCRRIVHIEDRPRPRTPRVPRLIDSNVNAARRDHRSCVRIELTVCAAAAPVPVPLHSHGASGGGVVMPSVAATQNEAVSRIWRRARTRCGTTRHARCVKPRRRFRGPIVGIAAVSGNIVCCGRCASGSQNTKNKNYERGGG